MRLRTCKNPFGRNLDQPGQLEFVLLDGTLFGSHLLASQHTFVDGQHFGGMGILADPVADGAQVGLGASLVAQEELHHQSASLSSEYLPPACSTTSAHSFWVR